MQGMSEKSSLEGAAYRSRGTGLGEEALLKATNNPGALLLDGGRGDRSLAGHGALEKVASQEL